MQEVVLALLANRTSYGYDLMGRLKQALGPLGRSLNDGQMYVMLTRLEKAGLVSQVSGATSSDRSDRKEYAITEAGERRLVDWLAQVDWPKPDLTEFYLKLYAAAAAQIADPLRLVDAQRRELLRRLRETQRAAMAEPPRSMTGLLLEGVVLRLQADLQWLEACEQTWAVRSEGQP